MVWGWEAFCRCQDVVFSAQPVRKLTVRQLDHAALDRVLESPYLPRLTHLRLHGNKLDNRASRALSRCPALKRLESLDLSDNRVQDAGIALLLESPHLASLRELIIERNRTVNWSQDEVDLEMQLRARRRQSAD
jgi:hypothetical protein